MAKRRGIVIEMPSVRLHIWPSGMSIKTKTFARLFLFPWNKHSSWADYGFQFPAPRSFFE